MNISKKAEKLADKIASSEAIFLYGPWMDKKGFAEGGIPVRTYIECFEKLLEYRFASSGKTAETYDGSSSSNLIPRVLNTAKPISPLYAYKNIPENLLLSVDMGNLNRRVLKPLMDSVAKFSRCAVTSDTDFYKSLSFDVIHVKDEAGLIHVLFGATELLKEKLPDILTTPLPGQLYA